MDQSRLPRRQIKTQLIHHLLLDWYRHYGRDLPWRHTHDPYRILVAEIMLQQTQVHRVIPKYHQWLEAFPTIEALAAAPTSDVIRLWAPLGYNSRAIRLRRIACQCVADYSGQLPSDFDSLLRLNGIGRYTAGAIACFAYQQQVTFWDTNVKRVLTRMFQDHPSFNIQRSELSPLEMEQLSAQVLPRDQAYNWHQALMDLGAVICHARNPRCDVCPVTPACAAHPAVLSSLPRVAEPRARYAVQPFKTTNRYFRGRVVDLLRQQSPRPAEDLLRQLQREDLPWFEALLAGLQRDGLARRDGDLVHLA